ncbi:MAG: hypothetical protein F6J93_01070 [Oscillatoria sp. SIO1A7]|nr:hypothetical protein [Oscillatoria sp. SIO1A7]
MPDAPCLGVLTLRLFHHIGDIRVSLPLETRNLRSRRTFPAERDWDNSMKFPYTPHPTPHTLPHALCPMPDRRGLLLQAMFVHFFIKWHTFINTGY